MGVFHKSLKTKIFINLLLASMIVVIVMNFGIFHYFDAYMREEINHVSYKNLENISTVYSSEIVQYQKTAQSIYRVPEVTSYIYSFSKSNILKEIDISNYIRQFLSVDDKIESIILFNQGQLLHSVDFGYVSSALKKQAIEQIMLTDSGQTPLLIKDEEDPKLAVYYVEREQLYGKAQNGIILLLNRNRLSNSMLAGYHSKENSIFLLDYHQNLLIGQSGYDQYGLGFLSEIEQSGLTSGTFSYEEGNEKILVSYVKDELENYIAISVVDYQKGFQELTLTRNYMILFTAIILLLLFLILYFLTNRIYRPIHQMLWSIRTKFTQSGHEQSVDDIHAASCILSDVSQKLDRLESQHSDNEVAVFLKKDTNQDLLPISLKKLEAQIPPEEYQYQLILLELDHFNENFPNLSRALEQWLENKNYPLLSHIVSLDEESVLLLIFREIRQEVPHLEFNQMIEELSDKCNSRVTLCFSEWSKAFSNLQQQYHNLEKLIQCRIFYTRNLTISYDWKACSPDFDRLREFSEQILNLVKQDREGDIQNYLQEIFQILEGCEYDDGLRYLTNLLTDAKNLSRNMSYDSSEYHSSYLDTYIKLQSCVNRNELQVMVSQVLQDACLELRVAKSKTVQNSMLDSVEYINEHFNDTSLSVDVLAERCSISPSYFSKLFNNYTQRTFPDYLNHLRLQKAAELLCQDKSIPINEISSFVGFSSNSYFAAAFKKKYGMSPSKFRMNH